MNGSPHNRIQISVFDKVLLERDLSATVIRTYTLTNVSDEPTSVEISRTEEFYPPVRQFQCPNPTANVQIVPSESEETSQVSWSLARHTLDPDESITVEFSFKREFLKVEPPLIGEFEYSSAERVIYSIEVIAPYRELLEFSDITITPEPMDSGKASFDKTDEGHLVVSPRRLSMNKGGKLSLRIQSNPPSVDTLPLLRILANQAKQEGVSISDLSVIIIPHLLTDFLSLIDALEAVGLDPERTFIIGIPYSLKLHVVVRLLHRGYKNIWAPSEYPFEQEIDEVIKAAVESVQSKGGKILVIEDGGYVIPRLHTRYPEYLDHFLGAVEQTANGIWAYRDNVPEAERRITNVNVAESELKKNSESPLIGDAVYMNVSRLLDNARVSARDREVLVVGYGATGSRVAESFKNNGARVTVYDEKPERREEARANGYNVADDLDEGIKNKFLVVGCTGKVSIGISPLLRAHHRTFFVNASSKRLEVNHAELQNVTSSTESAPGITTYHLVTDKDLLILADGFPVNFFDRSESVPDKELQFIYGLIFSAAVYLVKTPSLPADIVEVPKELQDHIESMHRLTR